MTARFCTNCGAEVSPGFSFCPNCGTKVQVEPEPMSAPLNAVPEEVKSSEPERPATPEVLLCPVCGYENILSATSCESCGSFLGSARRTSASEVGKPAAQPTQKVESSAREQQKLQPKKKTKLAVAKHRSQQKAGSAKGFHLEPFQIGWIVAAAVLGGVLVYGLLSSKPTPPPGGQSGGATQQQTTGTQPSQEVLHEIDNLREVVDKNPSDMEATLKLANILQDNQFYDRAVIYYKRYLEKVPDNVNARVDYATTLFEGGHTQDAISELKHALKIDPKHQVGLFNLGIVYLNAGDFSDAMASFKKCVQVDPNSSIGKKAEQTLLQHASLDSQEVK